MLNMLFSIVPNLIGRISDAVKAKRDLKRAIELKKLEIVEKKETADVEWERIMAEQSGGSWKDEFWTIVLGFLLLIPLYDPAKAQVVFKHYADAPEWFQLCVLVAVGASFGVKIWKGFRG